MSLEDADERGTAFLWIGAPGDWTPERVRSSRQSSHLRR
jgi:hypothetical protein